MLQNSGTFESSGCFDPNSATHHQQVPIDHQDPFATEKHRRQQLNDKFDALGSLIPNPKKIDRASVIRDAIAYINELKRTVKELKILADGRRCNRSRMKKHDTEINVRIIDDVVKIKLVQPKRINCLLLVPKFLEELQLDLHHVAGGLNGDFSSYLLKSKICEGSSVCASVIANKLMEVVDKQHETIPVACKL